MSGTAMSPRADPQDARSPPAFNQGEPARRSVSSPKRCFLQTKLRTAEQLAARIGQRTPIHMARELRFLRRRRRMLERAGSYSRTGRFLQPEVRLGQAGHSGSRVMPPVMGRAGGDSLRPLPERPEAQGSRSSGMPPQRTSAVAVNEESSTGDQPSRRYRDGDRRSAPLPGLAVNNSPTNDLRGHPVKRGFVEEAAAATPVSRAWRWRPRGGLGAGEGSPVNGVQVSRRRSGDAAEECSHGGTPSGCRSGDVLRVPSSA